MPDPLTRDDIHEALLLPRAVRACRMQERALRINRVKDTWIAQCIAPNPDVGHGPTLADALTALLRDLGADVPDWPSAERVAAVRRDASDVNGRDLMVRRLKRTAQRDPLAVFALIFEEASVDG